MARMEDESTVSQAVKERTQDDENLLEFLEKLVSIQQTQSLGDAVSTPYEIIQEDSLNHFIPVDEVRQRLMARIDELGDSADRERKLLELIRKDGFP